MAEPKTAPREYVVGIRNGDDVLVRGIGRATSASRAIDEVRGEEGGRWVAVPLRNWHEEDVEIEVREIARRRRVHPGQLSIKAEPEPVTA